jgi:hypothetical protein
MLNNPANGSAPLGPSSARRRLSFPRLAGLVLAGACVWAYWPTLGAMAERWAHDPQYSHGFLAPVFALILLWHRRDRYIPDSFRGACWGLALVFLGFCMRLAGTYIYFPWLEEASLLPCLFGGCLLLVGWNALRWAWPALTFLLFMIPLPFQIESALAHPLQRVATIACAASLELLGFQATAEGKIVWVCDEFRRPGAFPRFRVPSRQGLFPSAAASGGD